MCQVKLDTRNNGYLNPIRMARLPFLQTNNNELISKNLCCTCTTGPAHHKWVHTNTANAIL